MSLEYELGFILARGHIHRHSEKLWWKWRTLVLWELGGWRAPKESSLMRLLYYSNSSQLPNKSSVSADLTKTPCGAHSYAVTRSVADYYSRQYIWLCECVCVWRRMRSFLLCVEHFKLDEDIKSISFNSQLYF